MKQSALIFRINQLVRAIEERTGLMEMDFASREMLKFIGEAQTASKTLSVSDIVKSEIFGTPPTVYSRLTKLEEAGWINSRANAEDGRVKNIVLSTAAIKAFSRMSDAALKLSGQ